MYTKFSILVVDIVVDIMVYLMTLQDTLIHKQYLLLLDPVVTRVRTDLGNHVLSRTHCSIVIELDEHLKRYWKTIAEASEPNV
jgi:hypothetical protein